MTGSESDLLRLKPALSLPLASPAQTAAPLAMLYTEATGRSPVVITAISLIPVLNGALVQIIMASRVLYGMRRQGWLPPWPGQVSPLTHPPLKAIALIAGGVLLFVLWLPLLSLARLTSFFTLIVFALIKLSLWQLKRRAPQPTDIRTVPRWVPIRGFVSSSGFLLYQFCYGVLGNI